MVKSFRLPSLNVPNTEVTVMPARRRQWKLAGNQLHAGAALAVKSFRLLSHNVPNTEGPVMPLMNRHSNTAVVTLNNADSFPLLLK